jgi:phage tail sheath gpL-like
MSGTTAAPDPTIISFAEIPYTWKVPGEYMEVKAAISGNALMPFPARGLIMGQMLPAGTATPGVAYPLYSNAQINSLFGAGSILAKMGIRWLKANPYTPVDAIGIADASGSVKAAGAIAAAGTATAAGTQPIYLGGVRVQVPVNANDTAAMFAANAYAAIAQQGTGVYVPLPSLTATYTTGASTIALNAAHGGTLGNQIDVRINAQSGDTTPPGLTITVTPMSGGATDPSAAIAAALAGISTWYTDVAFAWTDTTNIGVFTAWLNARYGAMVKLDAHGYVGLRASYGTALSFAPNCKFLSVLPIQNSLSPPWEIAASMAGACCYSTVQKPSRQMKTVPLPGIVAPASADIFSPTEQNPLLEAGLSTYYTDSTGTVYLQRVVTTYRMDPGNIPNNSWFDLKDAKVPTRVRWDWNDYIDQVYPRNDLTNDGTLAAQYDPDAVTPGMLKASWTSRSALYEKNGWIQNSAVTAAQSVFAIDPNDDDRCNSRQQIDVMGNLMVLAGSLEFISNN